MLFIDIETYSGESIDNTVYKYVEHTDFEVMLLAYAYNDEPVQLVDLTKEQLPNGLRADLTDPQVIKSAFNANFERTCLAAMLGEPMPPEQWRCTMVACAMRGLPMSLAQAAEVLKLDEQKMEAGKALIRYFSIPCRPTRVNGGRERNLPHHEPERWELFGEYCKQDVATERAIAKKLELQPVLDSEWELWAIDQHINDRGVLIDLDLAEAAVAVDAKRTEEMMAEDRELTGLDNPNSVAQLKEWIGGQTGEQISDLTKAAVATMFEEAECKKVKRVLQIRQELGKSSVAKYRTMLDIACSDGYARGITQFEGAGRTGRWAGRKLQPQNLPQNHIETLDIARQLLREQDVEMIDTLYGNVPDTLSQLIRTALIAEHRFIVADFSAIEARVIAWLAGEQWRTDVFATHGKIYESSAALMYGCNVADISKEDPRRQKGKIAELACGYGGGVGALKQMGGERMGLSESEMTTIISNWRAKSPNIVQLWSDIERAAIYTIKHGGSQRVRYLLLSKVQGALQILLPSGRHLYYQKAHLTTNRWGGDSIGYWGQNQTTRKWERQETYGGKLTENVCQAIARDCLAVAMCRVTEAGYPINMHVHDELVSDTDKGSLEEVCEIMGQPIPWAKGLLLKADGYETKYYKK